MELYNEELTDLLSTEPGGEDQRLRLLEDRSGVNVQGLEEYMVKSAAEIYQARRLRRRRRVGGCLGGGRRAGGPPSPSKYCRPLNLLPNTPPIRPPKTPLTQPPDRSWTAAPPSGAPPRRT